MCEALQEQNRGDIAETVVECMAWREILSPYDSHMLGRNRARSPIWI